MLGRNSAVDARNLIPDIFATSGLVSPDCGPGPRLLQNPAGRGQQTINRRSIGLGEGGQQFGQRPHARPLIVRQDLHRHDRAKQFFRVGGCHDGQIPVLPLRATGQIVMGQGKVDNIEGAALAGTQLINVQGEIGA
jgi:hypothetical protein